MPYIQSIIEEEMSKKEKLRTGWPWRLIFVAFVIFGTTAVIFAGMKFGYQPYLDKKIGVADGTLRRLANSLSEEQQKNIFNLYSQLNNISDLLKSRHQATRFFDFLEKNTLKNVSFNSLNLNFKGNIPELNILGQALSFENLAQQLEVFKQSPDISKVILDNSRITEQSKNKVVSFSMRLVFK